MRKFWIGTAIYVTVVGCAIGGAVAAFNTIVGMPTKDSGQKVITQLEPAQRTSGKWTPVEIKREPAAPMAPLPPYVAPRLAAAAASTMKQPEIFAPQRHRYAERKLTKRVVISRRGYPPETRQVFAYAPEPPQFFGPFRFGF